MELLQEARVKAADIVHQLEPIDEGQLDIALASCKNDTGLGWDHHHPAEWKRLPS